MCSEHYGTKQQPDVKQTICCSTVHNLDDDAAERVWLDEDDKCPEPLQEGTIGVVSVRISFFDAMEEQEDTTSQYRNQRQKPRNVEISKVGTANSHGYQTARQGYALLGIFEEWVEALDGCQLEQSHHERLDIFYRHETEIGKLADQHHFHNDNSSEDHAKEEHTEKDDPHGR